MSQYFGKVSWQHIRIALEITCIIPTIKIWSSKDIKIYKNGCIVYYAYIHKSDLSILYLFFFSQPYQDKAYKEFEW